MKAMSFRPSSLFLRTRVLPLARKTNQNYLLTHSTTPPPNMAGGKKAKRGGTAKERQTMNASPPIQRNTAFIETASASERVFPREVRNQIYRYLLLGRNVKEQRNSELWNDKGPAYNYRFEVNVLRANKAVYAEGERKHPLRPSRLSTDLI